MPDGVSLVWLDIGVEPLSTEEPYKGKLYVRICGEGGRWGDEYSAKKYCL